MANIFDAVAQRIEGRWTRGSLHNPNNDCVCVLGGFAEAEGIVTDWSALHLANETEWDGENGTYNKLDDSEAVRFVASLVDPNHDDVEATQTLFLYNDAAVNEDDVLALLKHASQTADEQGLFQV